MTPSLAQLTAFVAVIDEGSFDAAGLALGVTTSAISQRVRGLERAFGAVLLTRSSPPQPTTTGERVLARARQIVTLVEDLAAPDLGVVRAVLPVAVGADALGTWFADVIEDAAGWDDVELRISVEDQDVAHAALARGEVMGALSARPYPQTGCVAIPLGRFRYLPCVSEALLARHGSLPACPMLVFGPDDELQHQVLRAWQARNASPDEIDRGDEPEKRPQPAMHVVGSMEGFAAAVRVGLGWGCMPEMQLAALDETGDIIRMPGTEPLDVPLYWHRWTSSISALDRLSDSVKTAAGGVLRPL